MASLRFEHLRADVFGLEPLLQRALTARPDGLAPLVVPSRASDLNLPHDPLDPGQVERDPIAAEERVLASEAIARELAAFAPHVAALDAARAFAQPQTYCVFARVDNGLGGGAQRNLWRALHTVALARELTASFAQTTGARVIPVVWVDGDQPPISRELLWLNDYFDLVRVRMASVPLDGRSASEISLDETTQRLSVFTEQIAQLAPHGTQFDAYMPREGDTFANAVTRTWIELLGPLGVCVFETSWLRDPLSRALGALADSIGGADLAVPIAYRTQGGPRRGLYWRDGALRFDDEPGSRTPAEFAAEVLQDPSGFASAPGTHTAMLAGVLPALAQVGSAEDLAPRWQARELEGRARGNPLPFVPGLQATWTDAAARDSLAKLELSVDAVLQHRGRFQHPEPSALPASAALREIVARASTELLAQRAHFSKLDRGLGQQLKRSVGDMRAAIEKFCVRAERAEANREGKGRRHERRLSGVLAPRGGPQADSLSSLQLVIQQGSEWIEAAIASVDPFPTEHALVHFE